MHRLLAEVHFEFPAETGNTVTMIKRIAPQSQDDR